MERLTQINGNNEVYCIVDGKKIVVENIDMLKICQRLKLYEDLEEQGFILRLPCKIGSILYQPIDNQINEYYIIGLRFDITRNKFMYEVTYNIGLDWYNTTCDFDYINDAVFLTKEEAEQKLKEMKEK